METTQPSQVSSFPAVHLSRYELTPVIKYKLNGVVCGVVL